MRLLDLPRNGLLSIRNVARSLRRKGLDFVVLSLEGPFPERTPQRPSLPFPINMLPVFPSETSLDDMEHFLGLLGDDDRVQGVVFRVAGMDAGSAALHGLREMILDRRPASEIKRQAISEGMHFLRDSALEKVRAGATTLEEINKVTFVH